jgi:diaminopimelate decarboxylase
MTVAFSSNVEADREVVGVAEQLGTPLFFYSLKALRDQIARLRKSLSGYPVRLLFATMANDRAEILRAIAEQGVGACINSIPHLQRALEHGFAPDRIQFTSCGLPVADMCFLQALSIPANLDSPSQIEAWCKLKQGAVVGARINAASLDGSTAPPDRIGMDIPDLERAREIASDLGGRVNGLHIYAGTNFQSARDILPILRAIFNLVRHYPDIDYLNIGGGIGIDYAHTGQEFEYHAFGEEVCSLARQVADERGRPLALLFEPGRSLVGCSARFITRITDIKKLRETRFVVVDGSVSLFPRPFHHPGNFHRVSVLERPNAEEGKKIPSTIVGRTTFSRDILGSYDLPENLEIGNYVAFDDAGAYCESMMSRFLGQREPMYFIASE